MSGVAHPRPEYPVREPAHPSPRQGRGRKGCRIEAKVSNRIYIEDRIAGDISGNRGFRCGVVGRCNRISAKNFAGGL